MGRTLKPMSRRGFRPRALAALPSQEALPAMTSCVTMMQADMKGAMSLALPRESISPSSGSMAALARWKRKQQRRKSAKVRLVKMARHQLSGAAYWPSVGRSPRARLLSMSLGLDLAKDEKRGDGKHGGDEEDAAHSVQVADAGQQQRGDHVACGVEALIAAELTIEAGPPDDAEGDGGEGGGDDGSSEADENLGRGDSLPLSGEGEKQGSSGEHGECVGDKGSLAVAAVDDSAGEWASGDGDEASKGKGEAGVAGVPVVGGEVSGEKRTNSSLDVGDEEVKPL